MSDREKLLGYAVGGLLVLFAVFGIYRMVQGGLNAKTNELRELSSTYNSEKKKKMLGNQAVGKVTNYRARSLPSTLADAQREFSQWLNEQVDEVGLKNKVVRPQPFAPTGRKKAEYTELSYAVTGTGDIKQITRLLYKVQTIDKLHRIRSLNLVKAKEGTDLKLSMMVDALSMPDDTKHPVERAPTGSVLRSLPLSLEAYEEKIANRNLFSPGNQAPKFERVRRQEAEIGKRFTVNLEAKDPEDDKLTFRLADKYDDSPFKVSKSGRLSFTPDELGDVEVEVWVTDAGIPAKESKTVVKINVVPEKIVEKEKEEDFDETKLTYFTAILQGKEDPLPQICLNYRSKDEIEYLAEGDDIEIGKWSGKILAIEVLRKVIRLETEDGQFELKLGRPFSDARKVDAL